MTTYSTLLLDQTKWDLVLDSLGNIAKADPPYSVAQDVASAIKLFLGELWYDTTQGVPYFQDVLGELPPLSLFMSYMERAALTVPGVVSAECRVTGFANRQVQGEVLFVDENGVTNALNF